jgi:hypothetical protein
MSFGISLHAICGTGKAPLLSSVGPSAGATTASTPVTLHGTDFRPGAGVTVNGVSATSIVWMSSTTITCIFPTHAAGDVNVVITNPDGKNSGLSGIGLFTYFTDLASLVLTSWERGSYTPQIGGSIGPQPGIASAGNSGNIREDSAGGGSAVGSTLNGFTSVLAVGSSGAGTAFSPVGSPGTTIHLEDLIDNTNYTIAGVFKVGTLFPIVGDGFSNTLIFGGGFRVTVFVTLDGLGVEHYDTTGTFRKTTPIPITVGIHAYCITFAGSGTIGAIKIYIDGSLRVSTPFQVPLSFVGVSVAALTGNAESSGSTSDIESWDRITAKYAFSFTDIDSHRSYLNSRYGLSIAPTPSVSSSSPNAGPNVGGGTITIGGSRFVSGCTVTIRGNAATSVAFLNTTQLTCIVPTSVVGGPADIIVVNPGGNSSGTTGVGLYNYTAPFVSSVTPSTGLNAGFTAITDLHGLNFVSGAAVTFDGFSATSVTWISSTQLTCSTPAHANGIVNVLVTNPDAQDSGTSGNGKYTYQPSFAPYLESLTSWFKAPSGSTPWSDSSSAGISGNQEDAARGTAPIIQTIGSITGLHYGAGGAVSAAQVQTKITLATDIGAYLDPSHYTILGLVYLASTHTLSVGTPYTNSTILCGDARWGVVLSTSGLGVWHYTGSFPSVVVPMSIGAWHFFCVRYDSTSGMVQVDIDNVAGTPTAIGAFAAFSGIPAYIAVNSYTSVIDDFTVAERATYLSKISDATRNNWYNYMKTTYPSAGLP